MLPGVSACGKPPFGPVTMLQPPVALATEPGGQGATVEGGGMTLQVALACGAAPMARYMVFLEAREMRVQRLE